jgi:hypothetical protein
VANDPMMVTIIRITKVAAIATIPRPRRARLPTCDSSSLGKSDRDESAHAVLTRMPA